MRYPVIVSLLLPLCLLTITRTRGQDFEIPLRINCGGRSVVDSNGNTWLADEGVNVDPLNIRPDDLGGGQAIVNWSSGANRDSVIALGFAGTEEDMRIFRDIRWDNAGEVPDWYMEIPVPNSVYLVNFYLVDASDGRHYQIELEGEVVEEDVHQMAFPVGEGMAPGPNIAGRYSFEVEVTDGSLSIGMLPGCCGDINPILQGLEVLEGAACEPEDRDLGLACSYDADSGRVNATWNEVADADSWRVLRNGAVLIPRLPADVREFTDANPRSDSRSVRYTVEAVNAAAGVLASCNCSVITLACPGRLECEVDADTGEVTLSWSAPIGIEMDAYEVRANGFLLETIDGLNTSYIDVPDERVIHYEVTPITEPPGACNTMSCNVENNSILFEIPLRINMGGPEVEDANGAIWLGDELGPGDALNIRPDDGGGTNSIANWCAPDILSIEALGFDPFGPMAGALSSIRWDNGGDAIDFRIELPVPDGEYLVNLFFFECCCDNRHFKIELEGTIVEGDVHRAAFAEARAQVGRYSFPAVEVEDRSLSIGLLPCWECPGATDVNSIISAIEVLEMEEDPCDIDNFRICPGGLECVSEGQDVSISWNESLCVELDGYRVFRDDEFLLQLEPDELGFEDSLDGARSARYSIEAILKFQDAAPCPILTCNVVDDGVPFEVPLRLNAGGPAVVDDLGRTWHGDEGAGIDPLGIRTEPGSGTNTILNWCTPDPTSLEELGFDPADPGAMVFNSIRWDVGGDGIDWRIELPIPDGDYTVNLYFCESCCDQRHFKISIEDEIVADDVHRADYANAFHQVGRYSFLGIEVADGFLSIGLLPCPECPGQGDINAILSALEVIPSDEDPCENPDFRQCAGRVQCEAADGEAAVSWSPPRCFEPVGYEVYRNDELILELDGLETSFEDAMESRSQAYRIETLVPDGVRPCRPMTCTLSDNTLPFDVPLRINAGGQTVTDEEGRTWLGDPGVNADVLGIRVDPLGGHQVAESWCAANWLGVEALGFNPEDPAIATVFSDIRWDVGDDGIDWVMEFPVPDGSYTVNLYFIECCCPNRHFKAEIQGEPAIADIFHDNITQVSGNSLEGVEVFDGILRIALLPCAAPECPGAGNGDALVSAIEILPEDLVLPLDEVCDNGIDDDRDGRADCDDTDCEDDAGCIPAEICDNGIDDDRDGAADCDDGDCAGAANCQAAGEPAFVRGDANSDGTINLTDGVVPLLFLFSGGAAPACLDSADTNDTGTVEITDAIIIFSWLFTGGAPPADPSPQSPGYSAAECGTDATADGIGCERPSPVCN